MDKENKKANFIKTKYSGTAEQLTEYGFKLIDYTNGVWTFINDTNRPLTFDNNKVVYSNMLHF